MVARLIEPVLRKRRLAVLPPLIKFALLCSLVLLQACGGGSGSSGPGQDQRPPEANPTSQLLGSWAGVECSATTGFSQSRSYVFKSDGTYDFQVVSFETQNCTSPTFSISSSGVYFEGDTADNPEGLAVVDLDIRQTTERSITPLSDFGVAGLNSDRLCDRDSWELGVSQLIGNCQIGNVEDITLPTIYRVYHLQDNHFIYFSNELSFVSDSRPSNLQTRPIIVRELAATDDFPADVLGTWRDENEGSYFEFRTNGLIYIYTPSVGDQECFDLTTDAVVKLGETQYKNFANENISLTVMQNEMMFEFTDQGSSILFSREQSVQASQLPSCFGES